MTKLLAFVIAVAVALSAVGLVLASGPGIKGGKFEVTCKYNGSAQVDPIVSPGINPSAHLHDFFGAKGVTENSTPDTLRGGPTSCVLSKDTAGYWVPAAYRSDTGARVLPVKQFEYYFGTPGIKTEPLPAGLEMVAGNSHALSPADVVPNSIAFSCGNGGSAGNRSPTRQAPYDCATDPNVVSSQGVTAIVFFPWCWDGVTGPPWNVVYGDPKTGACPASNPHQLPQLQEHEHFGNGANDPKRFDRGDLLTFSSGPWYTFHADYMQAWNQDKMVSLTNGCTAIFKDCGFLNNANPGPGG
jgi:hypothetical protein